MEQLAAHDLQLLLDTLVELQEPALITTFAERQSGK